MHDRLQSIKKEFLAALDKAADPVAREALRVKYFGRKGVITTALREVKDIAEAERPKIGKLANEIKEELQTIFSDAAKRARGEAGVDAGATFDTSLPGIKTSIGHLHPMTQLQYQVEDIFRSMGFYVLDGPEVESEYYNFTALNIPANHPARDAQDTFWLSDGNLLRTHTSPVQIRALQKYGAPFRGVVPGRVFRYEATDASHDHTFYQLEGLMVDRGISVAHLIGVMRMFFQQIFQSQVDVRLRPGYFPFVEPGFELDFKCLMCRGTGCSVCKQVGWIEMVGCGLVHPEVLRAGGIDPNEYSGFAFGIGMTRLAMMKYGMNDIRALFSSDMRFLSQF